MRRIADRIDWRASGAIVGGVATVAAAGAALSLPGQRWYRRLDKPAWQPPDRAFGPVWSILYILIAVSALRAWHATPPRQRRSLFALYGLNGALNAGWSGIFFRARRPAAATADSAALLVSTIALIARTRPHSRTASLALTPYAAWVAFATVLSASITRRNR